MAIDMFPGQQWQEEEKVVAALAGKWRSGIWRSAASLSNVSAEGGERRGSVEIALFFSCRGTLRRCCHANGTTSPL